MCFTLKDFFSDTMIVEDLCHVSMQYTIFHCKWKLFQIITVGRYGAGTTRSRIPLGSFYGHSYILPWEWREYADTHSYTTSPASSSAGSGPSSGSSSQPSQSSAVKQLEAVSQSTLLQQLGVFLSLQEDLQCRYSLACTRLSSLLAGVADTQFVTAHVKYYLKQGQRKTDEDSAIIQSYNECLQLQLQLNLAQRAIARLQRALGQCCVSLWWHFSWEPGEWSTLVVMISGVDV